jgi:hypothetical protein
MSSSFRLFTLLSHSETSSCTSHVPLKFSPGSLRVYFHTGGGDHQIPLGGIRGKYRERIKKEKRIILREKE